MSITLFKNSLKKNWILLLIFFAVLTMYTSIMISIYNPDDLKAIESMMEIFPKELFDAFGFSDIVGELTAYLASWLYGMLMFGFPMVYCIILGNRLVAKSVDNGSMAYLLSTPNSRVKIIITQGVYALLSIVLLFTALFGVGVLVSYIRFPDILDVGAYFKLNITTMLVNMAVMMITFFFSCLFNESKLALGFGAGIPIAFLLMNMLGGVSEDVAVLKDISIYGLYDPVELVNGSSVLPQNLLYLGLVVVLFAASVIIFKRKRLPL